MKNWFKKWTLKMGLVSPRSSMGSHVSRQLHWEVDVPFKILCWLDFYPQYVQEAALRAEKNEGFWEKTYLEELRLRHPEQTEVEKPWVERYSQWCDQYPPEEYVGRNHLKASELNPRVRSFLEAFLAKQQLLDATTPVCHDVSHTRL